MKKEILTIPNLLSLVRVILILPIAIFIHRREYALALLFVALSALTDVLDGIIARAFHQVSDLGKILDPIADKLTQCTLIVCLMKKYKAMIFMIVSFLLRECVVGLLSIYTFHKTKRVTSAKWYGKVNTVIIYGVMGLLLLFPTLPDAVANSAIWGSTILMQLSLIGYTIYYIGTLRSFDEEKR